MWVQLELSVQCFFLNEDGGSYLLSMRGVVSGVFGKGEGFEIVTVERLLGQ